jgi:hypothetical protein
MNFNARKTSFGRHETFSLRYGWLPKGFQAMSSNPKIFLDDLSTVELGVGKNMVKSIRHWLRATQMMDAIDQPTDLGKFILDKETGVDPFLEDEATLWLVHWLLASNAHMATAWYWFFNCFQRIEFTAEEVVTSLGDFIKDRMSVKVAASTVKADAMMILRMYCTPDYNSRVALEDSLDAPLALLGLLSHVSNNKVYQSRLGSQVGLPDAIMAFALAQVVEDIDGASIPIEELMYSDSERISLGGIFRLTESEFVARLERICTQYPGHYEIRDTAGISQLYILSKPTALDCLIRHYTPAQSAAA